MDKFLLEQIHISDSDFYPEKPRDYWDTSLEKYMQDLFIDNFTDFSDSTCFTYFIPCDKTSFPVGSKALTEYLHKGNSVCYLKFQISLRAPIACAVFMTYDRSPTSMKMSEEPLSTMQEEVLSRISLWARDNGLYLCRYSDLINTYAERSSKKTYYGFLFEPDTE